MSNKKVLVIDFDAEFLQTVTQFLRTDGYQVVNAMDGIAGLEKFKAEEPDLVVMEAMLPRLHGFELCSKIAKDERHVPVIIMTGVYKDPVYKTEALRTFGATAYFEKPFSLDSLRTTIRRILNTNEIPAKKEEKKEAVPARPAPETKPAKAAEKFSPLDKLRVEKKKESAHLGDAEVDRLLNNALADFGLGQEKKKPAVKPADLTHKEKTFPIPPPRPAQVAPPAEPVHPPVKEAPAKEIHVKETPFKEPAYKESDYKEPEVKEPAFVEPPPVERGFEYREETAFPKAEPHKKAGKGAWDPFLQFYPAKKKSISPRLIGIAAGVLIISSVAFYFLRPHKNSNASDVPPNNQVADSTQQNQDEKVPLSSQQLLNTIEKMGQTQETGKKNTVQDKMNLPPSDAPPVDTIRPEDVKPITPTENSKLQIQLPDAKQIAEAKTEAQGQGAAGQGQAANPEAKQNPPVTEEAQTKPNQGDLLSLDLVDSQPIIIRTVEAIYPAAAQIMKVEGQVSVSALISEFGDVLQVRIIRGIQGNLGFEKAAENAVKQWKFKPAQKDGVNVKVWKPFVITFKLKR